MTDKKESTYYEISLADVFKLFLKRWFFILMSGIVFAFGVFGYKYTRDDREYKSSALVYVNNTSLGSVSEVIKSISYSDIQASKLLVSVYSIIIKARTQLDEVSDYLENEYGIEYSYTELNEMITVGSENETEIIRITAKGRNKEDVIYIANAVADVMIDKVDEIIIGSKVKIVDRAQTSESISRGTVKATLLAGIVGGVVACAVIFFIYLFDNSIESEDWLRKTFGEDIPLLSIIPNSLDASNKKYGYRKYGYKSYYQNENEKDIKK